MEGQELEAGLSFREGQRDSSVLGRENQNSWGEKQEVLELVTAAERPEIKVTGGGREESVAKAGLE